MPNFATPRAPEKKVSIVARWIQTSGVDLLKWQKHPEIRIKLEVAGDDFRIVDHVTKAASIQPEEIEAFWKEAISAEDRDLLRICERWVTLVPE